MLIEEIYNLDKKENSPVIVIPWFHNCRGLIDTGSTMPMWLKSIVPLKIKGAVQQDRHGTPYVYLANTYETEEQYCSNSTS